MSIQTHDHVFNNIYGLYLSIQVFSRWCTVKGCTGKLQFDGNSQCLLNMKTFLVTYEVLRAFIFHFLLGRYMYIVHYSHACILCSTILFYRATIFTEYSVLREMHYDSGNTMFSSLISYHHYRTAWYAFLHLLQIDYHSGFMCQSCGAQPEVVIMDATSLAFRKELDSWQGIQQPSVGLTGRSGSKYVFVTSS